MIRIQDSGKIVIKYRCVWRRLIWAILCYSLFVPLHNVYTIRKKNAALFVLVTFVSNGIFISIQYWTMKLRFNSNYNFKCDTGGIRQSNSNYAAPKGYCVIIIYISLKFKIVLCFVFYEMQIVFPSMECKVWLDVFVKWLSWSVLKFLWKKSVLY